MTKGGRWVVSQKCIMILCNFSPLGTNWSKRVNTIKKDREKEKNPHYTHCWMCLYQFVDVGIVWFGFFGTRRTACGNWSTVHAEGRSSSIEVQLHMFITPTSILDWTGYCLMQSKGCDLRHDRPKNFNFFQLNLPPQKDCLFLDEEHTAAATVPRVYLTPGLLTYDFQSHFLLFVVPPTYQHRSGCRKKKGSKNMCFLSRNASQKTEWESLPVNKWTMIV